MGSIPETMLACQLSEYKKPFTLATVPTPKPGPKELLIRIHAAGVCHSDYEIADGILAGRLPQIASHEGAGTVVGWGSEVMDWSVGERVMCPIIAGRCGACEDCMGEELYQHYCDTAEQRGVQRDGAFAEFMLVDADETVRLPDEVSFEIAAPLACAGRTVYRAVTLPELKPGQTLAIVGSGGGLGHIGIQFAKALGLKVIGIDARDSALSLSRDVGADVVLDARDGQEKVVEAVRRFTVPRKGVEATVNLSNHPTAAAMACAVTRTHGTLVHVAVGEGGAAIAIPWAELLLRDIRLRGTLICSKREAEDMLALVAKAAIDVKRETASGLDKVNGLFERGKRGEVTGKPVVLVHEEDQK